MKNHFDSLLRAALQTLELGSHATEIYAQSKIERTRSKEHGDLSSNLALVLANALGLKAQELATRLVAALPSSAHISHFEVAGPGFVNAFFAEGAQQQVVNRILEQGSQYGRSTFGLGKKIHIEYVSANPTGPLHVGHGRGAAYGGSLANLLTAVGYEVHHEYYVNDAGRQMDILATSVWLRYLELCGEQFQFPSAGYQGDYIFDIAASVHRAHGEQFHRPIAQVYFEVPADEAQGGDKDEHIDALIVNAQRLLAIQDYRFISDRGLNEILSDIRKDLTEFGVNYQSWFSELSLAETGQVDQVINTLKQNDSLYEIEGAWWLESTRYEDEKDRVVIRRDGRKTYFASDIAYHAQKLNGEYDQVINIWGADHHSYITRVKAAMHALGKDPERLTVLLVQFVVLYRDGEKAQMSTRSGEFVTLRELREEVGNDAARFFYVLHKSEHHMDFDLSLAKSRSKDNPVYYIQYAHARVCSVVRKLAELNIVHSEQQGAAHLHLLTHALEQSLVIRLTQYPEVIETAARNHEPHLLAYYLRDLAHDFHGYYNAKDIIKILEDEPNRRDARLNLSLATKQVLSNGLTLLGVSAPEKM